MKKIKAVRLIVVIMLIALFGGTYLYEKVNLDKWYVNKVEWNGQQNTSETVTLKNEKQFEMRFVPSCSRLDCFYVIVERCMKSEQGVLRLQLLDANTVLFDYALPLNSIDKEGYYIPCICNVELDVNKQYSVVVSAENTLSSEVEIRSANDDEMLIGLSYTYMDNSVLYVARGIIIALLLLSLISPILWQMAVILQKRCIATLEKHGFHGEKEVKEKVFLSALIIMWIFIALFYNALASVLVLLVLITSGWCLGFILEKKIFKTENDVWVTIALGLGMLGCLIYFIFEFGFGKPLVVGAVLFLPILINYKRLYQTNWNALACNTVEKIKQNKLLFIYMSVVIYICIAFAFSPIDDADALVKHLPITVYASNNGQWYHNIIEDAMAYSESTLLAYCYSVLFAFAGEIKGYILFNVFLMFGIYDVLLRFMRKIYSNTKAAFFAFVFFSTPLFLSLGTSYMVDILPAFWVVVIMLNLIDINENDIVTKLPQIAFFYGLCVFTKLTILSSLCIIAVIIFWLLIMWGKGGELSVSDRISAIAKAIGKSILCFVFPFGFSFARNYYMTGNPFSITAYNDIFKSPYFGQYSFGRPFADLEFNLSFQALYDLIFRTNKYIEMNPLGVGVFLMLVLIVPVTWIFYRKRKYIVWSIVPIAIYYLGGIIVANLRYIWVALAIELGIITVACSIWLDKVREKWIRQLCWGGVCMVLVVPNLWYINEHMDWQGKLIPDETMTICKNSDILSSIPQNSKVLSINDDQKGLFEGFYWTARYANAYIKNNINDGIYSMEEFVEGFDYVLLQKEKKTDSTNIDFVRGMLELCNDENVMKKERETAAFILYKVVANSGEEVCLADIEYEEEYFLEQEDIITTSVTGKYDTLRVELEYEMEADEYDYVKIPYTLEHKVSEADAQEAGKQLSNFNKHTAELWCGISWNDSDNEMIVYENIVNQCYSSQKNTIFGETEWTDGASSAYISIRNAGDSEIKIKRVKIYGIKLQSVLQQEIDNFNKRKLM